MASTERARIFLNISVNDSKDDNDSLSESRVSAISAVPPPSAAMEWRSVSIVGVLVSFGQGLATEEVEAGGEEIFMTVCDERAFEGSVRSQNFGPSLSR